ncbi:beta-propeller domain-containing protein [Parasphingopyxis marina]|uniref:Beta-propeller domain-containing protein n=1 Tax=Parasphingopyxis marina TaxID=2761622 RepID=A0A842HWE5_9SPHN|nr:beta-propeller domain-containing protein [Parasphingopyxis marina]MBC2776599.1 beta-propeller domain-containing protein [Parasphingopyxis marina]
MLILSRRHLRLLSRLSMVLLAAMAGLAWTPAAHAYQREGASADRGLEAFRSERELQAFFDRVQRFTPPPPPPPPPPPAPPSSSSPGNVSPPAVADESITNNQEAGVDEGGIVKVRGDILVILRRGRLFTISIADGGMRAIDRIDAFPPGADGRGSWYDEMLIADNRVIVIGYSYRRGGTEVNRFRLSDDGHLTFEDAHQLRSSDYYSSSNYASRLIGNRLVFYAPIRLYGAETLSDAFPAIKAWRGTEDDSAAFVPLVGPRQVYATAAVRRGAASWSDVSAMHSVTSCDLTDDAFDCSAIGVIGGRSREFYVTRDAVYLWVTGNDYSDEPRSFSHIYRLPLDASRPSAIGARGVPLDQFSFHEDREAGRLDILVRAGSGSRAMWLPEAPANTVSLLQLPLDAFGNGSEEARQRYYRHLEVNSDSIENRFVGNALVYGHGHVTGYNPDDHGTVRVVPLDGGAIGEFHIDYNVERIEAIGADALIVGSGREGDLGFTTIGLGGGLPALGDVFAMPAAAQGEARSHAYFFRPDPGSPGGASGTLGLPIARAGTDEYGRAFGRAAAMLFLRREDGALGAAGELASQAESDRPDNCVASCTDWYGNARPIFLRGRAFALLGYEMVEGRIEDGAMTEIGRLDFAPPPPAAEAE